MSKPVIRGIPLPVAARLPVIELPAALGRSLGLGHPWVYRDHVPRGFEAPAGTWVEVRSGSFAAFALWDPDSPLALRIFSREAPPDAALVEARVHAALALREVTGVTGAASAYRWVHGEGDGLPGVVVDRYGAFASLSVDTPALEGVVPWVAEALSRAARLHGVVRRRRGADTADRLELVTGRLPSRDLVVEEHGHRFVANLREGQKTGLFLDQRENRRHVAGLSAGRRVLNLFGYTGAFSVYAARGGAARVTTVDVAAGAVEAARENFRLNGLDADAHDFIATDAFEFLAAARPAGDTWELVIADPPSFARSRAHRDRAIATYARLHEACLAVTSPGGLYAASSCSTQVSVEAFRESLAQAARKLRRSIRIVHDAGHAADHPILPAHPEGRYLKFIVVRVEPPR